MVVMQAERWHVYTFTFVVACSALNTIELLVMN